MTPELRILLKHVNPTAVECLKCDPLELLKDFLCSPINPSNQFKVERFVDTPDGEQFVTKIQHFTKGHVRVIDLPIDPKSISPTANGASPQTRLITCPDNVFETRNWIVIDRRETAGERPGTGGKLDIDAEKLPLQETQE